MHTATLWEITTAADVNFDTPVASIFTTLYLTTIPVIGGLLPSTNYLARATYFDDMGQQGVGPATAFTTAASNSAPQPGSFDASPGGGSQGCGDC